MMKKTFFVLLLLALMVLAGCSSKSNGGESQFGLVLPASNYATYNSLEFRLQYPINWKVLEKKDLSSQQSKEIEVAFMSNFKDMFFTPTITVEKISADVADQTSLEFADRQIVLNSQKLLEYDLLDRQTITLQKKTDPIFTSIVRFRGKLKMQDDTYEYLQTYIKSGDVAYIVTGAYDFTDNRVELEKISNSLKTFKIN